MDFFSRATSFLFLFFARVRGSHEQEDIGPCIFLYFNSKFHLETVPSESHACYI